METKFNFNSQVCSSIEQSRRLLALGLKKETADMNYTRLSRGDSWTLFIGKPLGYEDIPTEYLLPAWSLHRLIEMMPREIECDIENGLSFNLFGACDAVTYYEVIGYYTDKNLYNAIISCIEDLIKEGYFNKEYLV